MKRSIRERSGTVPSRDSGDSLAGLGPRLERVDLLEVKQHYAVRRTSDRLQRYFLGLFIEFAAGLEFGSADEAVSIEYLPVHDGNRDLRPVHYVLIGSSAGAFGEDQCRVIQYSCGPLRGHVGNTIFVGGADEALLASDHVFHFLRQLWHSVASSSIEVIPIDRHHCRARKLAPGDQQGSGIRAHAHPAKGGEGGIRTCGLRFRSSSAISPWSRTECGTVRF